MNLCKLVIYLSQTSLSSVVCQFVRRRCRLKRHLGRPLERKSRVVNLYIYIMESLNKMIKIPLRFYYIFKKKKKLHILHFTRIVNFGGL